MRQAPAIDGADILDLVHESIFARDLDLRITFWNAAAEELYGWTRAEALGRHAEELLHCVHPLSLAEREAQSFETGRWQGEFTRVTKSGARILVDARWSVRRDAAGQPIEIVETGRDITDKRRAEEALRETEYRSRQALEELSRSEAKYRNLFNYMPIALWQLESRRMREMFDELHASGVSDFAAYVADHPEFLDEAQASLTITDANERTLELFGATDRETLLPKMPRLWLSRADWAAAATARLAGKCSHSGETRIQRLDGRLVDVVYSVAFADPANPDSGNMVGAIDISELKQATAALAQSELKYRDLFQHMPLSLSQLDVRELVKVLGGLRAQGVTDLDAYMDAHPDFLGEMLALMRVEGVNQHTVKMFGGRDTADFVGPIDRFWEASPETVRRSLVARFNGAEAYAEETRLRTLDGRVIEVFYTSAFPKALSELGIGLVGMIDIGDRIQAERMLQQVQADFAHAARVATLGELTASIAHEVNQPLAAIATNGEASLRWLARPEPNIGEVKTLAARMVADARRAAEVITQIRSMAARHETEHEPLAPNPAVEEVLRFLHHEFQAHGVTVRFEAAPGLPPVRADRTQFQQVLVNLAVNAVQAMAQQGSGERRLTLRTALAADGKVRFEVEDNGPGIPTDQLGRLFDSFYTTKQDGLGIGLSICRTIIEAHGGAICCENVPDGAQFTFTLPGEDKAGDHTNV